MDSIRVGLGAVYTQSAVASTRNITLPTAQALTADYAASTGSLFGEAAKEFDLGVVSLTPYAGAQYVRSMGDAYSEQGGTAALSVAARTNDIFTATVGLRTSADFVVGGDKLLTLGAGAGWKHAFADQQAITHSFVAGGNSFAISSAQVPPIVWPWRLRPVLMSAPLSHSIWAIPENSPATLKPVRWRPASRARSNPRQREISGGNAGRPLAVATATAAWPNRRMSAFRNRPGPARRPIEKHSCIASGQRVAAFGNSELRSE